MPKLKTHRSAAKRYKVTASGKIMKRQAGIGHLLQHKSASRKRRIFKMVGVSESHVALVSKELPYKKYSRYEHRKWELNVVMQVFKDTKKY